MSLPTLIVLAFFSVQLGLSPTLGASSPGSGESAKLGSDTNFESNSNSSIHHKRLRKLSYRIRGIPPHSMEYGDLELVLHKNPGQPDAVEKFFDDRAQYYLTTGQHFGKLYSHLEALFRQVPSPYPPEVVLLPNSGFGIGEGGLVIQKGDDSLAIVSDVESKLHFRDSMRTLFWRVVSRDESWDQILTSREYLEFSTPDLSETRPTSDEFFYQQISGAEWYPGGHPTFVSWLQGERAEDLLSFETEPNGVVQVVKEDKIQMINFRDAKHDDRDPRFAGAITTWPFAQRFRNNSTNKNFRRAAEVFRVFLCEPMQPLLIPKPNLPPLEEDELFHGAENRGFATKLEERHTDDSACKSCHDRLDPMGELFQAMDFELSSEIISADVRFFNSDPSDQGSGVHTVRGIGGMADLLAKEDLYVECQVEHFWKWYVGEDQPLLPKTKVKLAADYRKSGGKISSVIRSVVATKEFYTAIPEDTRARVFARNKARPYLQQCSNCHTATEQTHIPDFSRPGFRTQGRSHAMWVEHVANSTDAIHDGKEGYMPMEGKWPESFQKDAISAIKGWICAGAPGADGEVVRPLDEVESQLCQQDPNLGGSSAVSMGFHRYTSSYDILRTLQRVFPLARKIPARCRMINEESINAIRPHVAKTGEAISPILTQAFIPWYSECVKLFVDSDFSRVEKSIESNGINILLEGYTGKELLAWLSRREGIEEARDRLRGSWDEVPAEIQLAAIQHRADKLIGRSVLNQSQFEDLEDRIVFSIPQRDSNGNLIGKETSVREALKRISVAIVASQEFLRH